MSTGIFNKQGQPMTFDEYGALCRDRRLWEYKRIAETTLPDGRWVSTVWLGHDYSFGDGPPIIFETMVFESKTKLRDLTCRRYSTLAEAEAGHVEMVQRLLDEPPEAA